MVHPSSLSRRRLRGCSRRSAALALVGLAAACATGRGRIDVRHPQARELSEPERAAWRAYLEGRPEDALWRSIPWRTTFAEGLRDAAREERPLLLWGMNGHPLGAT